MHGRNTVQLLACITPVQTLICTAPNPRMCSDGHLDNEGTRSGLAVSSAYPTHKQPLPSPPTVAQSVERATPGEEVLGSIPSVATCSLLVGSV